MSFLVQLDREAPAEKIGGKARSLVKLAAGGLPVPRAIAVTTDLFTAMRAGRPPLPASLAAPDALATIESAARALRGAPWPAGFAETLARALETLDARDGRDGRRQARFVVRSSAAMEDQAGALGAGLFLSRLDLPAAELEQALRDVLASALAPGVIAYLARRSLPIARLAVAVLIHPFVAGDASGTAALDSSHGAPVIEAHLGDATLARGRIQEALVRLSVAHGPVEVEWVASGPDVTFLQMRPYRQSTSGKRAGPNEPGWRWDAAHNPLPLSPAQAGLVALVDRACETGLRQKTIGGYLFYSPAAHAAGVPKRPATSASEALAQLHALADARLGSRAAVPLDQALDAFLEIYQLLFGVVQPAARAARQALADFLRHHGFAPADHLPLLLAAIPSLARQRTELARAFSHATDPAAGAAARAAYLDRFGDESPCWDVAVPTWRESPDRLDRRLRPLGRSDHDHDLGPDVWRVEAESIRSALPEPARAAWDSLCTEARAAAAGAEDDDALYARAQAHVRRALLREGARLAARELLSLADDVFWLPFDLVAGTDGAPEVSRGEATRLVDDARRANLAAREAPPSLAQAGPAVDTPGIIRGRAGSGGVRIGRVRIWNDSERGDDHDTEPAVIVARTILPTELPLIAAAALVVETGGPLDHVAAQARERGIPAVVGAVGATTAFEDGDRVLVDGDAGLVARID